MSVCQEKAYPKLETRFGNAAGMMTSAFRAIPSFGDRLHRFEDWYVDEGYCYHCVDLGISTKARCEQSQSAGGSSGRLALIPAAWSCRFCMEDSLPTALFASFLSTFSGW